MQHADSAMTEWYDQSEDFRGAVERCRLAMAHTWYPILISNTTSFFYVVLRTNPMWDFDFDCNSIQFQSVL